MHTANHKNKPAQLEAMSTWLEKTPANIDPQKRVATIMKPTTGPLLHPDRQTPIKQAAGIKEAGKYKDKLSLIELLEIWNQMLREKSPIQNMLINIGCFTNAHRDLPGNSGGYNLLLHKNVQNSAVEDRVDPVA